MAEDCHKLTFAQLSSAIRLRLKCHVDFLFAECCTQRVLFFLTENGFAVF